MSAFHDTTTSLISAVGDELFKNEDEFGAE
jgi:hypothetical protein